jgi:hypothetical protein
MCDANLVPENIRSKNLLLRRCDEQRKESDYAFHIGSQFVVKRKCGTGICDKPLLVRPIAKNVSRCGKLECGEATSYICCD